MKLFDKIKLAWHNIKTNKARSFLTSLIVLILGSLIMGLIFIGLSFSNNMESVYIQLLKEDNVTITHYNESHIINLDELELVFDSFNDLIAGISLHYSGFEVISFKHFKEIDLTIVEGNAPINYENKNYVYLPIDDATDYKINDIYETYVGSFIIAGFYHSKEYLYPIIDLKYCHNNLDEINYFSIKYVYDEGRNVNQDIKNLNKLDRKIKSLYGSNPNINTISDNLDSLNRSRTLSTIVILSLVFIAIILILLSIGSISNSIMISVDKNHKYYGLLKTLGISNQDIKGLVIIETFFTIVFGIIIASLLLITFIPLIEKLIFFLLEFILKYDFYAVFQTFKFRIVFPIYLPFVSIIVFTFFSILFSQTSITRIIKSNPIDIINEVK